jgi:hypothetical protein
VWTESSALKTAMVVSSSYSSPNTTVTITGNAMASIDSSSLKYAAEIAKIQEWIIPGNLAVVTDGTIGRKWRCSEDIHPLAVDFSVGTAGTTNATTCDVYDDGSTIITTKPSIATGTTEGANSLNCKCDDPATVIAAGSIVTVGVPACATTPPVSGYIQLFYYPSEWRQWT